MNNVVSVNPVFIINKQNIFVANNYTLLKAFYKWCKDIWTSFKYFEGLS